MNSSSPPFKRFILERAAVFAKLFAERPIEKIWEWADNNVFFDSTMAETPTPYRSSKTPWTRRLQEIAQNPIVNGVRIRMIVIMKSSQSGFTEAILNCIRYFVKFSPRNVIYAINSQDEARNIADRLTPTLKDLGEGIFTGDTDDERTATLRLRHMKIWFYGAGAEGKFANKQAPTLVCDEYEEHPRRAGFATSLANLLSRMKKSAEGLVFVLSKPKMWGGPIHAEYLLGDQEIFLVPCPHCGTMQEIKFESLKFDHCRDLLGEWDKTRVLNETYVACAATDCTKPIYHHHLQAMIDAGHWMPTANGNPNTISMHMSDYYDADRPTIWGEIAIGRIDSKGDPVKRMSEVNHRDGLPWRPHAIAADRQTILGLREPYNRGSIPFAPWFDIKDIFPDDETVQPGDLIVPIVLGGDTQQAFSPWVAAAIGKSGEIAIIDWGRELHPASLVKIALEHTWPEAAVPNSRHGVIIGGVDSPYRHEDVYEACLHSRMVLWPVVGAGGMHVKAPFAIGRIPTYPNPGFGLITFNDFDFKCELSLERIPARRLIVPMNIDQRRPGEEHFDIIAELIAERLEENRYGNLAFTTAEPGKVRGRPNHSYDCVKIICLMWRYMMRKRDPDAEDIPEEIAA